jgi:ATP-binding cassette, subfamily A (ABC1), member 3
LLERWLYDAHELSSSNRSWWNFGKREDRIDSSNSALPAGIAISIRNLEKTFSTSIFRRKQGLVTAVADLTVDIPKSGIFVLLGSNG